VLAPFNHFFHIIIEDANRPTAGVVFFHCNHLFCNGTPNTLLSTAPDNSPVHVTEIEDNCPLSPVPLKQETLVEALIDNDTSKEQEATNVSLT